MQSKHHQAALAQHAIENATSMATQQPSYVQSRAGLDKVHLRTAVCGQMQETMSRAVECEALRGWVDSAMHST